MYDPYYADVMRTALKQGATLISLKLLCSRLLSCSIFTYKERSQGVKKAKKKKTCQLVFDALHFRI